MDNITVMIADDHPIVRYGLQTLLGTTLGFETVGGPSKSNTAAVQMAELFQPSILIVDQPTMGVVGQQFIRQVHHRARKTRIIIFTVNRNQSDVQAALQCGASGYIMKNTSIDEIGEAVTVVASGGRYVSQSLLQDTREIVQDLSADYDFVAYETLTNREREVFHLAAEGYTYAEIGERLFISPRTAESHRTRLMHKLKLKTLSDLIRYAIRNGIVSIEAEQSGSSLSRQ